MTKTIQYITITFGLAVAGLIFYGLAKIENSKQKWEAAVLGAEALASNDAKEEIANKHIFFLVATFGAFNPNEVPGIGAAKFETCFPSAFETKVFYEGTDIPLFEDEEEIYLRLVEKPRSTWEYAIIFNSVMYNYASNVGITKCT